MNISLMIIIGLFFIRFIEALFIYGFYPFIYKFGLIISDEILEETEILDFSSKIGQEYEKKYTKIKVLSQNEFYLVPKYDPFISRFQPYLINKCIYSNGEYKFISIIPISYFIITIIMIIIFLIKKEMTIEIQIVSSMYLTFLIISIIANNWIKKFMKNDINEFLRGLELY
jgi:hypothetical protein